MKKDKRIIIAVIAGCHSGDSFDSNFCSKW